MRSRLPLLAALCFSLAAPALAQERAAAPDAGGTPAVDTAKLPVNLRRIGRQIRQAEGREQRNGLTLHYTIDVYGQAPPIQIITPQDNVFTGSVRGSSPTHSEMLMMMTPPEFRTGGAIFGAIPRRK
jgi:hypothetical protein